MLLPMRAVGSLVAISCLFRLVGGYATGNPSLSNLQQVLQKQAQILSDKFDFSRPLQQRTLDALVPEDLEEWIHKQRKLSYGYMLDNIAPNGTNAKGAASGTVIASPSREAPNYYYQWVRDAAITVGEIVEEFGKTGDLSLKSDIDAYADLQGILQNTFNPSGGYTTGGLGEPKFEVDGAPFTDNWGRPQRDGPALRALTLINYIKALNATHPALIENDWLRRMYDGTLPTHSVIKADLEYVSHTWNMPGFDLWEEVNGLHLFTGMVQHKALVEGRDFAMAFGDSSAAEWYESQQLKLKDFLKRSFWDEKRGHLISMLNISYRNGLDAALLLGSLHGGQEDVFPPWSDEILASLEKLVTDMATRHPINRQPPPYYAEEERLRGVGIGRYPEDVYDGVGISEGNPWFLCTSTVSSVLYKTIARFVEQGSFEINDVNLGFFNRFHPDGKALKGKYTAAMPAFEHYLVNMFKHADSFLNVIRWHATADGRLSEQFNKYSGYQVGAHDLTWSYGSFIGAVNDRRIAQGGLLGRSES